MANTNGFDPAAWAVDGARHRGEIGRVLAYAATAGSEGIVNVSDCKVTQLGTAGPQVNVGSGAVLIRNRSANVVNQTYVANGRLPSVLDVAPTGVGVTRSDAVLVRVKDPQYGGAFALPNGADPLTYQYTEPFILQNVSPSTTGATQLNLGYPAVMLARLDLPASTTNITTSMIKDMRRVALPRSHRVVQGVNNAAINTLFNDDTSWYQWPIYINHDIDIPEWATAMTVNLALGQIIPVYTSGSTTGYLRLTVNSGAILGDSVQWEVDSQNYLNPIHILNADEYAIPANLRGTIANFKTEARKISGTSDIRWHPVSSSFLDITFLERAV